MQYKRLPVFIGTILSTLFVLVFPHTTASLPCSEGLNLNVMGGIKEIYKSRISISEDIIPDASQGESITSYLLPGASDIITFLYSRIKDAHAYISITSTAEKLELYAFNHESTINTINPIWKKELLFDNGTQVLKLPANVSEYNGDYSKYSFYIQIVNPTSQRVNYTVFILELRELIGFNNWQRLSLEKAKALFFKASSEDEIIEISIFDRNTFDGKAYYWNESTPGIPATNVSLLKIEVTTLCNKGHCSDGLIFRTNNKIGQFMFLFTNTIDENINFEWKISTSTKELAILDSNSQLSVSLIPRKIYTYQTVLYGSGAWYLWGYICKKQKRPENLSLSIQNLTQEGTKMYKIETDLEYFYQAINSEVDTIQAITLSSFRGSDFILKSTFLPGAGVLYNYKVTLNEESHIYYDKDKDIISVRTSALQVIGYDPFNDRIVYEVLICPTDTYFIDYDTNLCQISDNCIIKKSRGINIDIQDPIEIEVQAPQPGNYSVTVLAHIMSRGQEIKFVRTGSRTLEIMKMSVVELFLSFYRVWGVQGVALVIIDIVLVTGLLYIKCLRRFVANYERRNCEDIDVPPAKSLISRLKIKISRSQR